MAKATAKPIGEVECIAKSCTLRVPVYKYAAAEPGKRQLFAGKLYSQCPTHGRFGWTGQPSSQGALDYILENAEIWGDEKPENPAPLPATEPEAKADTPKPPPTPKPEPKPESVPGKPANEWAGYRSSWPWE